MKTSEVATLLKTSRYHVMRLADEGKLKVNVLPNGRYEYDNESVFQLVDKPIIRKNVIYIKVRNSANAEEVYNQRLKDIQDWCNENSIEIDSIYKDIHTPFHFEKNELLSLILDVTNNEIDTVYVWGKSTVMFSSYENLFSMFGTKIVCINPQYIEDELYRECEQILDFVKYKINEKNLKKLEEKLKIYSKDC